MQLLSPALIEMLIRLDDGPPPDSVGLRAEMLSVSELQSLKVLYEMGLILVDTGWRNNVWFRLSPAARRARLDITYR